ncbi:UDP-glucose 4-epimerase [Kaistia sp. 32K]|uniref:NAD-dependent epimerase/dehydratase family protein n=1 Tax=Kaistia sp. 32K TaxID=2795690 RepID=UPI0019160858|nr:NAD-dependent epimerase/dehydratase family protein [Kaistia sp. 32K]BCP54003.1 UDP-glucose 4-epimerase [Kaistia sp. 32K]
MPAASNTMTNTVLITGAAGFIVSNVAKEYLSAAPEARVIVFDKYKGDDLAQEHLRPYADRVEHVFGDIRDKALMRDVVQTYRPQEVIHAAAITHQAQLERDDPSVFIDVNINGTVSLLEAVKADSGLRRFVYVSTGGVYGEPSERSPAGPQGEEGPFDPPELYAVSKYTSELLVRRYGKLFGFETLRVRFADVFGPMERATGARTTLSLPYGMMRAVLEGRTLKVSSSALDAKMDIISAEEIALAFTRLLLQPGLPHDVYNIASGQHLSIRDLLEAFRSVEPRFSYVETTTAEADVTADPSLTRGRYNAYDVSRMRDLGWQPRPLKEQLERYRDWVAHDPVNRCPATSPARS